MAKERNVDKAGIRKAIRMPKEKESPRTALNHSNQTNVHAVTNVGARPRNEDYALTSDDLFIIADGLGSPPAGHLASQTAAHAFYESFQKQRKNSLLAKDPARMMQTAMLRANERLKELARKPEYEGLGTTLVAAYIERGPYQDRLHIVHAGDSRAHIVRNGTTFQLTTDQTLAQDQYERGSATPRQFAQSAKNSLMYNAIAGDPIRTVHQTIELQRGDKIVLTTDGVHGPLTPVQIAARANAKTAKTAAERLVRDAVKHKRNEFPDNATAVVYFHKH